MSQFNLTNEEDVLVIEALKDKAAKHSTMFSSAYPALEDLIVKVESQIAKTEVVEDAIVVEEIPAVEEELVKTKAE